MISVLAAHSGQDVEVGAIIAFSCRAPTRNTDINFDMQQRRASWMIVALSTLLAAGDILLKGRPRSPRSNGWSRVRTDWRRGIYHARDPQPAPMSWEKSGTKTLTSLPARWKKPADAPRLYGGYFHELRTPLAVLRGELEAIQMAFASSRQNRLPRYRRKSARLPNWLTTCISCRCSTRARWLPKTTILSLRWKSLAARSESVLPAGG